MKRTKRPSEYLHEDILPRVFDNLPAVLPGYDWRRIGNRWEGVGRKGTASYDAMKRDFGARPERVHIVERQPGYIRTHGGGSVRLLDFLEGGQLAGGDFVAAVKRLGERVGFSMPDAIESPEAAERRQERELSENRLDAVFAWCHEALKADTPLAARARDYLNKRGLDMAAAAELEVGLYYSEADLSARVVAEYGGSWKQGHMEGRLVFPWRDVNGCPTQLWGRRLDSNPDGKWLGLAERERLPGVTRNGPLYLDRAKAVARSEGLVFVEGVLDAALAQACGDRRVVAIGGAAMRRGGGYLDAIKALKPARVYVCLDPDKAGDEGAGPVLESLIGAGLEAWACPRLPEGLDPDEYILRHGLEAWRQHVGQSEAAILGLVRDEVRDIAQDSPDPDKLAAVKRVADLLGRLAPAGSAEGLFVPQAAELLANRTGYQAEALEAKLAAAEELAREAERTAEAKSVANRLLDGAKKGKPIGELIDTAAVELAGLRPASGSGDGPPPEFSVDAILEEIRRLPPAIKTGWRTLDDEDKLAARFVPGELSLIGARTGHCKTTFLANLFWRWAVERPPGRLVFVTTEEPRTSILARLVALAAAEADPERVWGVRDIMNWVRDPRSRPRWPWDRHGGAEAMEETLDELRGLEGRVDIVWKPEWHAGDIAEFCRRVRDEDGLAGVVVDYLQRLRPMPNAGPTKRAAERRDIEVSLLARELKALAVNLAVPVVCGGQVNRASITTKDGARDKLKKAAADAEERGEVDTIPKAVREVLEANRPDLHHLREGGAEQEADMVLGLMNYGADWQNALKKADATNRPDDGKWLPLGIGTLKNRYGAVGKWRDMRFWGKSGRIADDEAGAVEFDL